MKHIVKNQTPECRTAIRNFIRDKRSRGEKAHYDNFLDRSLLRLSLLKEQGYICAYCMQRIENNPSKTKIEHWKTRQDYNTEGDNEGTLDYDNLLVVCEGKTADFEHCDTIRGKKNPKLTINPTDRRLIEQISFLRSGKIKSEDDAIDKDLNEHLNLNLQLLQDNRKKALNDIQITFEIRCKGKNSEQSEKLKKLIVQQWVALEAKELEEDGTKIKVSMFRPYSGIIAYFYKKYL